MLRKNLRTNAGKLFLEKYGELIQLSASGQLAECPVVLRAGVSTGVIADRIDAGESPADLADDYNLILSEIERAIVYERAA